jgi:hypothetical protein
MAWKYDHRQHSRFTPSLLLSLFFATSLAQAEETAPEPISPPTLSAEGADLIAKKDKALLAYGVGNTDAALSNLRALITTCDEVGEEACSDPVRAELYVALAIVLAGGKDDIPAAARLFHAALTRDPDVMVPREFATVPVQKAMREANESTSYQALGGAGETTPTETPAEANAAVAEEPAPDPKTKTPRDNKTGILLLHGIIGAGAADDYDVGTVGVAGVLGVRMVKDASWTTAIRGRASVVGYSELSGVALLMGGSWFNHQSRNLGYFLGGLGIDSYASEAAFTTMIMGGLSLKGFLLGGGAEFGAGNESYGLLSLHLGWGGRL